jgi:predicted MFS family arabinose efflux permease
MSLSLVFAYTGASLGSAVGGIVLASSGFLLLGIVFGLMNIFAALTIFTFANDPSKP